MTYLDYILLAVLAVFFVKGIFKGLIRQVMSLAGMIAGLVLAWKFYPVIAVWGVKLGIHQTISMIISFAIIYVLVIVITRLLTKLLDKTIKFLFLGWINRLAGGIFGLAEGLLLIVIILVLVSFTPLEKSVRTFEPTAPVLHFMKKLSAPFASKVEDIKLPSGKIL